MPGRLRSKASVRGGTARILRSMRPAAKGRSRAGGGFDLLLPPDVGKQRRLVEARAFPELPGLAAGGRHGLLDFPVFMPEAGVCSTAPAAGAWCAGGCARAGPAVASSGASRTGL